MSWQTIDTVLCARCAVYTEVDDLSYAPDGTTFCGLCGPPPAELVTPELFRHTRLPNARELARSPLCVAAAICAGLFVAFLAIVELST